MAVIYKGFASPVVGHTEVLYDEALIKRDLLNHFNTRKGERAMDAEYGFIGWDLIFELDIYSNKQLLEADARRIVATDPRVSLQYLEVLSTDRGFRLNIFLLYVELDTEEILAIEFDRLANEKMAIVSNAS